MYKLFILSLFFLVLNNTVISRNWYISSTGNDANAATIGSPWATINKLNSSWAGIAAGDSILFAGGDTFYGEIIVGKSGTSGNKIVIGSYGAGRATITGFTALSGFSSIGGNIYSKTVAAPADVNMYVQDNAPQQIAQSPNGNVWYTYTSYGIVVSSAGTNSFVSSTTPVITAGDQVIIKKQDWDNERDTVTAVVMNTVYYRQPYSGNRYTGIANYGWKRQRNIACLDIPGEWYYNGTTLYVYGDPAGHSPKIATKNTGIYIGSYAYITIENLNLEGFNNYGIYSFYSSTGHITVQSCDMTLMGESGCTLFQTPNAVIDNCTASNCLGNGLFIRNDGSGGVNNSTISNCTATDICQIPGMEISGDASGRAGITATGGANVTITGNTVLRTGYAGIEWKCTNGLYLYHNFVSTFCNRRQDGGGIYAYNSNGTYSTWTNNIIRSNIVLYGVGSNAGTTHDLKARGIYNDEGTNGVLIDSNSIAYCASVGIYGNSNSNMTYRANTAFKNGTTFQNNRYKNAQLVRNIRYVSNIFFPYNFSYFNSGIDSPTLITVLQDIQAAGVFDSSIYYTTSSTPVTLGSTKLNGTSYTNSNYSFSYWQGTAGKEANAVQRFAATDSLLFEYSTNVSPVTFSLGAKYINIAGDTVTTITLSYGSFVGKYAGPLVPVVPPAGQPWITPFILKNRD